MANEFLSAAEYAQIQADVRNAIEGLGTPSVTVYYEKQTVETFTATSNTMAETAVTTQIVAHRAVFGSRQRVLDGTERGQVTYIIEARRLVAAGISEPARHDRISEGNPASDGVPTYEVQEWHYDPLRTLCQIHCVKVAPV